MGVGQAPENLDQIGINLSEAHPSREPDLTMVGVPGFSGAILATSASRAIHVSHPPFLKVIRLGLVVAQFLDAGVGDLQDESLDQTAGRE